MTISTKGRYGLTFMLDVLEHQNAEPVRLKDVANRQELSEKYLEQIAIALKKGGLLKSCRGAHGGYRLAKPSREYTVGEILRTMEGNLAPVPCLEEGEIVCKRKNNCTNVILWNKINDAICSVVDTITLEDMNGWKHHRK